MSKPVRSRPRPRITVRIDAIWRRRPVRLAAAILSVPLIVFCFTATYYYVLVARQIDARLHGERERVLPRVLARPLELRRGQGLTEQQLVDRLNDLGYAERPRAERAGEFQIDGGTVEIMPRGRQFAGRGLRVLFQRPAAAVQKAARRAPPPPKLLDHVDRLELGSERVDRASLDAPVLTSLIGGEREKRRPVALSAIPPRIVHAVLAIEDHRFYDHPGVDVIGTVGALMTNMRGIDRISPAAAP